jgi:hypothetical protein
MDIPDRPGHPCRVPRTPPSDTTLAGWRALDRGVRRRALLDGWRGLGQADPGVAALAAARAHRLLQLGAVEQAFTLAKRVLLLAAVEARQAGQPLGADAAITFLPRDPRQAPLGLRVRGPVGDLDAAVRRLGGVPFRDLRGRP